MTCLLTLSDTINRLGHTKSENWQGPTSFVCAEAENRTGLSLAVYLSVEEVEKDAKARLRLKLRVSIISSKVTSNVSTSTRRPGYESTNGTYQALR